MKKHKIAIGFTFILLLGLAFFKADVVKASDEIPIISETEYLQNIEGVKQIDSREYMNLTNKSGGNKEFIVFFGFKECKYCRAISPVLKEYLSEHRYPVYYMNMNKSFDTTNNEEFEKINKTLTPYDLHGTPTFAYFKNGKIQNMLVGYPLSISQLEQIGTSN